MPKFEKSIKIGKLENSLYNVHDHLGVRLLEHCNLVV